MKPEQEEILRKVAVIGRVEPDTFTGRGYLVAGLVRCGWLEWERGNMPKTTTATGLLITEEGRLALRQGERTCL